MYLDLHVWCGWLMFQQYSPLNGGKFDGGDESRGIPIRKNITSKKNNTKYIYSLITGPPWISQPFGWW